MTEKANLPAVADSALLVEPSHFESRRIEHIDEDTLRIKPTLTALGFSLLFVVLGLIIIGLYLASTFTSFDGPGSMPLMLIGVLFAVTGIGTYYSNNEQLMIKRDVGVAFVRSWSPSMSIDSTSFKKQVRAQDIIAIQTISRIVKRRTNRSARLASYTEYQVNICTSDTERHNVFITLKSEKAAGLGNHLAQLFEVPLWAF